MRFVVEPRHTMTKSHLETEESSAHPLLLLPPPSSPLQARRPTRWSASHGHRPSKVLLPHHQARAMAVAAFTLALLPTLTDGAPLGPRADQAASLEPLTVGVLFLIGVAWVVLMATTGSVAGSNTVDLLPSCRPTLNACDSTLNAVKNTLEIVFICPCAASIRCSVTFGIWLARGSPLTVCLKVLASSVTSGGAACGLGYLGAFLFDRPAQIDVSWDDIDNSRVKRTVMPPTQLPSLPQAQLIQGVIIATLPLLLVAATLPLLNAASQYLANKVGKSFSLCVVTSAVLMLSLGVFLTAFALFHLGPVLGEPDSPSLTRPKREALSLDEVENLFDVSFNTSGELILLPDRLPVTSTPTNLQNATSLSSVKSSAALTTNQTWVVVMANTLQNAEAWMENHLADYLINFCHGHACLISTILAAIICLKMLAALLNTASFCDQRALTGNKLNGLHREMVSARARLESLATMVQVMLQTNSPTSATLPPPPMAVTPPASPSLIPRETPPCMAGSPIPIPPPPPPPPSSSPLVSAD